MDRRHLEEELPGFRFHPTEEELLDFYLKGVVYGKRSGFDIIGTVNIYRHDPWELPGLAKIGHEREWYFFVPRDRKHSNGGRPNRTTETGFWKATGSDRQIRNAKDPKRIIGLKKTLVFYKGRAPRGTKTDWVMNEYRLPDSLPSPKEDIVLCKVYRKATSLKVLEQRADMEEESHMERQACSSADTNSSFEQEVLQKATPLKEEISAEEKEVEKGTEVFSQQAVWVKDHLTELYVPKHGGFDWAQDPFLLRSPWVENWASLANAMYY